MKFVFVNFSLFLSLLFIAVVVGENAAVDVVVAEVTKAAGYDNEEPLLYANFPDGFEWGVATASYQVRGSA